MEGIHMKHISSMIEALMKMQSKRFWAIFLLIFLYLLLETLRIFLTK